MWKSFMQEWKGKSAQERLFMVLGGFFLIAAIVGVFLPIVPQVPFAIISAFFFSKGSKKIHAWIRKNKYLGKPVSDWEDHRVLRPKLKVISTVAMIGGAVIGHYKLSLTLALILDGVFLLSILFVLTRKSKP